MDQVKFAGDSLKKNFFGAFFNTWIHMLLNIFSLTVHGVIELHSSFVIFKLAVSAAFFELLYG